MVRISESGSLRRLRSGGADHIEFTQTLPTTVGNNHIAPPTAVTVTAGELTPATLTATNQISASLKK